MCGIAGVMSETSSQDILKNMCDRMTYRGPDEEGFHNWTQAGLGIRRLSIMDPEGGSQPLYNDDQSIGVVCNGEIYNHRELRRQLSVGSSKIKNGSDVAVIPYLYEEHGPSFVEKLRGMFAFALWDNRKKRLLLGRDRLGQKPLYYYRNDGDVFFSSTLDSLKSGMNKSLTLNNNALGQYLLSNRVPSPHCIYNEIKKIRPGHFLVFDGGQKTTERYWTLSFSNKHDKNETASLNQVDEAVSDAVEQRLMSDVPLGFFLSGGVDSSLVTAYAKKLGAEPLRTFSVGFENPEYSELKHARKVADYLDTDHHELVIRPDNPEKIRDMVSHLDEPFADASFVPVAHVSELASNHVKTVLTGDGADETFGGYEWYRAFQYAQQYSNVPTCLRKGIASLAQLYPDTESRGLLTQLVRRMKHFTTRLTGNHNHPMDLFHALMGDDTTEKSPLHDLLKEPDLLSQDYLRERRFIYDEYDGDNDLEGIMYTQLKTLLPDLYFTKVDRMSMMHSLEARSPFADHQLQETIARLPVKWKLRKSTEKYILKKVAEQYLPKSVIYRQKMGFGIPIGQWMREGKYRDFTGDILNSQSFRERDFFNYRRVQSKFDQHISGNENNWSTLWTILCLELWFQENHDNAA